MSTSYAGGADPRHRQRRTGGPPRADPGHPPPAADPHHHRIRHLLRRLHRPGHRLRDALTRGGMEPHPRLGRLHPLRRLPRPTHRRDHVRLARREDRPPTHPADHHRAVRLHGRRLPVRLERRLHADLPLLPRHRHRRRGPRRQRLHQRVHRRQEARPVLPALRAHLPDRPAVRRPRRLLPRPALRLARPVHRRPRPGRADDPDADLHARVPALARLQGPHREGRQGRLHARARGGQGRQAPHPSPSSARSTPRPPRSPTGANCSTASTSSAP